MAGSGGLHHSVAARIVAKQEFAGYWEYVLDEAIFIAPAHPFWGGAALLDTAGALLGIGSLQLEQKMPNGESGQLNMVVPIDLLKPILDDLLSTGRPVRPPHAWLGMFATDLEGKVFVVGVSSGAPADRAGVKPGDLGRLRRRGAGLRPRRVLPQGLVTRPRRSHRATRPATGGRDNRNADSLERAGEVSQEAEDAFLTSRFGSS